VLYLLDWYDVLGDWVPECQEGRAIRQLLRKLMTPWAMRLNSEAEVSMLQLSLNHCIMIGTCEQTRSRDVSLRLLWYLW
jgi:hypothetical protein